MVNDGFIVRHPYITYTHAYKHIFVRIANNAPFGDEQQRRRQQQIHSRSHTAIVVVPFAASQTHLLITIVIYVRPVLILK